MLPGNTGAVTNRLLAQDLLDLRACCLQWQLPWSLLLSTPTGAVKALTCSRAAAAAAASCSAASAAMLLSRASCTRKMPELS